MPRCSRIRRAPGSALRWLQTRKSASRGSRARATGPRRRRCNRPRDRPAPGRRAQHGSRHGAELGAAHGGEDADGVPGLGPVEGQHLLDHLLLAGKASPRMPVPGPTARAGSSPVKAQTRSAATALLAIPISPTPRRAKPWEGSSGHLVHARAQAGFGLLPGHGRSRQGIGRCPAPRCAGTTPGKVQGAATPASMTRWPIRLFRQRTLMAAPPAAMLATICGVTSGGKAETPCRAMPWSPPKVRR